MPTFTSEEFNEAFPHLFRETTWGLLQVNFQLRSEVPPAELIANVSVVPFVQDRVVIIQLADGAWEIPGGPLEPGETFLAAAKRELAEEAGAILLSFQIIGAWHCRDLSGRSYRPHLPFPTSYRLVGIGQVQLIGAPGNPAEGEQVSRVEIVPVDTAAARFLSMDRFDLADLYRLASRLRSD